MSEPQSPNNQSPQETLLGMALGYMLARAVHVAAEMGIADLLSDGPKRVEELAQATGARPQSLYRLLRALAGNGIFAEDSSGRFELTPAAAWLRSGIPVRCATRYGWRGTSRAKASGGVCGAICSVA
jgi:Dimerisation domain